MKIFFKKHFRIISQPLICKPVGKNQIICIESPANDINPQDLQPMGNNSTESSNDTLQFELCSIHCCVLTIVFIVIGQSQTADLVREGDGDTNPCCVLVSFVLVIFIVYWAFYPNMAGRGHRTFLKLKIGFQRDFIYNHYWPADFIQKYLSKLTVFILMLKDVLVQPLIVN